MPRVLCVDRSRGHLFHQALHRSVCYDHVAKSCAFVLTDCAQCLTFLLQAAVHTTLNSRCFIKAALPSRANNKQYTNIERYSPSKHCFCVYFSKVPQYNKWCQVQKFVKIATFHT